MGRLWRVFNAAVEQGAGERVVLDADQGHHVRRVLRLRQGDALRVFNGRGREWEAVIETDDGREIGVRLGVELDDAVEPSLAVELFQASCRPEKLDWVIQKATEVGVVAIHVVETSRSEPKGGAPRRIERWSRIAIESAKQCGRRVVPALAEATGLPATSAGIWSCLLTPASEAPSLAGALPQEVPGRVWVGCGPESGFSPDEVELAIQQGWIPVQLGPRVLRAETAGLVAATILLHRLADLGR